MSLVLLVLATACQQAPPPGDDGDDGPSALRCEREGLPCTLGEVPVEVFERTYDLTEQAARRIHDDGQTAEDVAAWLETLAGIAEIDVSTDAVRFRLEGGRPSWILMPKSSLATASTRSSSAASMPSGLRADAAGLEPNDVVGNPDTEKRAVILAPFAFEDSDAFPAEDRFVDESLDLENLLDATAFDGLTVVDDRGYNDVDLRRDAAGDGSTPVTTVDFASLAGYDLVHIATHGGLKQICPPGSTVGCEVVTVLATSQPAPTSRVGEDPWLDDAALATQGLAFVTSPASGRVFIGVTQDFFFSTYQLGITDATIFINGCNTVFGEEGLADSMRGEGSVFFGWSAPVSGLGANLTSIEFYMKMLTDRRISEPVHDEVFASYIDPLQGARLLRRPSGPSADLRLLESVTLVDDAGRALGDGIDRSDYVVGTPGDGTPDRLEVVTRVDGVESGEKGSYSVRYSVDGTSVSGTYGLGAASASGEFGHVAHHEIPLGFDVQADTPDIRLRAEIDLPEGGTTAHEVVIDVSQAICSWEFTSAEGDYSGDFASFAEDPGDGAYFVQMLADEHEAYITAMFDSRPPVGEQSFVENGELQIILPDPYRILQNGDGASCYRYTDDYSECLEYYPPPPTVSVTTSDDSDFEAQIQGDTVLIGSNPMEVVPITLHVRARSQDLYPFTACGE